MRLGFMNSIAKILSEGIFLFLLRYLRNLLMQHIARNFSAVKQPSFQTVSSNARCSASVHGHLNKMNIATSASVFNTTAKFSPVLLSKSGAAVSAWQDVIKNQPHSHKRTENFNSEKLVSNYEGYVMELICLSDFLIYGLLCLPDSR